VAGIALEDIAKSGEFYDSGEFKKIRVLLDKVAHADEVFYGD